MGSRPAAPGRPWENRMRDAAHPPLEPTASGRLLPFVMGVYVGTLVISNVLSCKIVDLRILELTAGTVLYPITYVVGDILTEVYGYRRARTVIWTGTGILVLMILMTLLVQRMPGGGGWSAADQAAFDRVLVPVVRINLASICAVFGGEFMNAYVLARMKVASAGRHMGVRFIASTMAGQALDSVLFMGIAFAGTVSPHTLLVLGLSNCVLPASVREDRGL